MKQIYNFEQYTPPVLNENLLLAEKERRKLRWQTALIALAGILMQVAVLMFGFSVIHIYPALTLLSIVYAAVSSTGAGVLTVVYTRKGGVYNG